MSKKSIIGVYIYNELRVYYTKVICSLRNDAFNREVYTASNDKMISE
jgi:hypothetical protein